MADRGNTVLLLLFTVVTCGLIATVTSQTTEQSSPQVLENPSQTTNPLYQGSQKFALNFFKHVHEIVDADPNVTTTNIVVSPLSVWSLLALTTEGAGGQTLDELLRVLQVEDQGLIRRNYKDLQNKINVKIDGVEISSVQFMFTDKNQPVLPEFENSITRNYGENVHEALEFSGTENAVKASFNRINEVVAAATKNQIQKAVNPRDIARARLVLLSALFFQGAWTLPFNRSLTTPTRFYDENEKYVADVDMMYQKAVFPFAAFRELEAQIVELPYGSDRQLSMMLILPRKGVPLKEVIDRMVNFNMQTIYQELKQAAEEYEDDEVEVYLPRFNITADYHLNAVLYRMGIQLAFQDKLADFKKMANDVFLGTMIQKSKIVVNEEGTTAAAVTTAVFANKATPPRFFANRPFAFMIVDKRSDLILFMGQVKDPNAI